MKNDDPSRGTTTTSSSNDPQGATSTATGTMERIQSSVTEVRTESTSAPDNDQITASARASASTSWAATNNTSHVTASLRLDFSASESSYYRLPVVTLPSRASTDPVTHGALSTTGVPAASEPLTEQPASAHSTLIGLPASASFALAASSKHTDASSWQVITKPLTGVHTPQETSGSLSTSMGQQITTVRRTVTEASTSAAPFGSLKSQMSLISRSASVISGRPADPSTFIVGMVSASTKEIDATESLTRPTGLAASNVDVFSDYPSTQSFLNCHTVYQTEASTSIVTIPERPVTETVYPDTTPSLTTITKTIDSLVSHTTGTQPCFWTSDNLPRAVVGLQLDLTLSFVIDTASCDAKACADLCLLNGKCKAISHTQSTCSLLSIQLNLAVVVSDNSETRFWNKCTEPSIGKRQLGVLDPILAPITTALPLSGVQSLIAPVISQLNPLTTVLSVLDPLTTLAAVVSPVASLVDPILTALDPLITPATGVLGPVETGIAPVITAVEPAVSGIVSALLPAVTPVPSLLDPLIPVESTVLSNVDSIVSTPATTVSHQLTKSRRPILRTRLSVD